MPQYLLGLLLVDSRIDDAMLAAQIGDGNPCLMLLLNVNILVFSEHVALHLRYFQLGQSLPHTVSGRGVRSVRPWHFFVSGTGIGWRRNRDHYLEAEGRLLPILRLPICQNRPTTKGLKIASFSALRSD